MKDKLKLIGQLSGKGNCRLIFSQTKLYDKSEQLRLLMIYKPVIQLICVNIQFVIIDLSDSSTKDAVRRVIVNHPG